MACQRPPPPGLCGSPELYARSYTLPPRWPFGEIHLVMESQPGTCDLYNKPATCCALITNQFDVHVERHTREPIISFLAHCSLPGRKRPCAAVDLGANNGWMSSYMLALGAHVISVEPASDLASAVNATVKLNCWSDRSVVLNAYACERGLAPLLPSAPPLTGAAKARRHADWQCNRKRAPTHGWRIGGASAKSLKLMSQSGAVVGGISVEEIFTGEPARRLFSRLPPAVSSQGFAYDFVKLDGDGPEGKWLRALDLLLTSKAVSIQTIVVEGNNIEAALMSRYQRYHGYRVYRLDVVDERRFITAKGWDAYSPRGTFARLDRFRSLERNKLEEEMFGVRAMRHLFSVKPGLSTEQWEVILQPILKWKAAHHFVLTHEANLLEPSIHRRGGIMRRTHKPGPEAAAANYTASPDALD